MTDVNTQVKKVVEEEIGGSCAKFKSYSLRIWVYLLSFRFSLDILLCLFFQKNFRIIL